MAIPVLPQLFVLAAALQGIHAAAERGDAERVRSLLHLGQKPDEPSAKRNGRTPLHCAAEEGHVAVVQALAEAGASTNARTVDGWTPLHLAASSGETAAVVALLEAGAEREAHDEHGDRALHLAAENAWAETIATLIGAGAEVDARDRWGRTPLLRAALFGHLECARVLLGAGADANALSGSRASALSITAQNSDAALYALLIESGADLERLDGDGRSPKELFERARSEVRVALEPDERAKIDAALVDAPLFFAWRTMGYPLPGSTRPDGLMLAVWAEGVVLFAADAELPEREMRVGRVPAVELEALRRAIDESGLPSMSAGVSGPDSSTIVLYDLREPKPAVIGAEPTRLRDLESRMASAETRRVLRAWMLARSALLRARPRASCALSEIAQDGAFRGWRADVLLRAWLTPTVR